MNPLAEPSMADLWLAAQSEPVPTPAMLSMFTSCVRAGVLEIDMSKHGVQPNMALLYDLYRPAYVAYLHEQALTEIETTVFADMVWAED